MNESFPNAPDAGGSFERASAKPEIQTKSDFDRASKDPNAKEPETLTPEYRPPELVPGGVVYAAPDSPTLDEVMREELDGPARDAMRDAQHRFDEGHSEGGDLTQDASPDQGWTRDAALEFERSDSERGPGNEHSDIWSPDYEDHFKDHDERSQSLVEPDLNGIDDVPGAAAEYMEWSRDNDPGNEHNTPEGLEDFDSRMEARRAARRHDRDIDLDR